MQILSVKDLDMRLYWILGWALNPKTSILKKRGRHTETNIEEGHVNIEVETGVMLRQAKECQGLPTTTRK